MGVFAAYPALTALTAASTAVAVYSARESAAYQQAELDVAARQEGRAAQEREVARKRRLAAILGSQSAAAAASGLAMSGSVANISLTDAQRAGEDSLTDDVNTRQRIDALRRQRHTIGRMSNIRTATSIMGGAERAYTYGKAA